MSLGKNIKSVRLSKKLNQSEFSKLIGISRSYLSDLENDRKSPSIETISKISEKLDVSTLYLLTGKKTISDYESMDDGSVIPGHEWIKSLGNEFYDSALVYSDEFLKNSTSFGESEIFAISKLYNLIFTFQGIELDYPENYKETIDFVGVLLQNLNYQIEKNPDISLQDFYTNTINKTEYPKNN